MLIVEVVAVVAVVTAAFFFLLSISFVQLFVPFCSNGRRRDLFTGENQQKFNRRSCVVFRFTTSQVALNIMAHKNHNHAPNHSFIPSTATFPTHIFFLSSHLLHITFFKHFSSGKKYFPSQNFFLPFNQL